MESLFLLQRKIMTVNFYKLDLEQVGMVHEGVALFKKG
jgi:hypothetical protein